MSVFVGREHELAVLRESMESAIQGGGSLVLLSGEAGIGKTSLVQRLVTEGREKGSLVLSGHCYDLTTTPPYGLWLDLTDRYRPGSGWPELPEVLKRNTGVGELSNQLALFEVARDFLDLLQKSQPVIVVLEDVHWADEASLNLLRYLARHLEGRRILLIVIYRDDEVTRDHPLFALLPALIRESRAIRIELNRFKRDDVQTLVSECTGLADPGRSRLVDYLLAHAEGHPLFSVEVLRTLEQNRFITRDKDGWTLADLAEVPLPALVMQVIEGRVSQLGDENRYYLEVAAVIGHHVSLDLWRDVAGMGDADLLEVLSRAFALHLLEPSTNGSIVSFVHALTRQALYESILPPQRRLWHRLIAENLAASSKPNPDAVSYHFREAGDDRAIDWLICSGNRAHTLWALQTASHRFDSAQALMAHDESRMEMRGWLLFRLGHTVRFTEHERSLAYLHEAERIADVVSNRVLKVAVTAERGFVYSCMGLPSRGLEEVTWALSVYDTLSSEEWEAGSAGYVALFRMNPELAYSGYERELSVVIESRRALIMRILANCGQFQRALELRKVWEPRWTGPLLSAIRVNALGGWIKSELALGRPGNVLDDHRELIRRSSEINNFIVAATDIGLDLQWRHLQYNPEDLAERERLIAQMVELYQLADKHGNAIMPPASSHKHPFQFWEGIWDDSVTGAETLLAHTQGQPHWHVAARVTLATIARHRGEYSRAWKQVGAGLQDGPETEPGNGTFLESMAIQRIAVALSLDSGDLMQARVWLEAHDQWLEYSGAVLGRAEGLLLRGELQLSEGDIESAQVLAKRALEHAERPRQPIALIACHRLLGSLAASSGGLKTAERHLNVSLRLAEACRFPFEKALTMLVQAELRVTTDAFEQAEALLESAAEICEPLRVTPTLQRIAALRTRLKHRSGKGMYPDGLTRREVDVLRLVATGKSNREIAEELFLSPRTVERHLANIYTKTDLHTKAEAAIYAVQCRLV